MRETSKERLRRYRIHRGLHNPGQKADGTPIIVGPGMPDGDTFDTAQDMIKHNTPGLPPRYTEVETAEPAKVDEASAIETEPGASDEPAKPDDDGLDALTVSELKGLVDAEGLTDSVSSYAKKSELVEAIRTKRAGATADGKPNNQ